jgi:dihydroflavonol-4-reductase
MLNTAAKDIKVVVTGANGHLGTNIVSALLARGYQVRATVRDLKDKEKTKRLASMGVEIVEANLLDKNSLVQAFKGQDGVFQLAAGFKMHTGNPEFDIRRPAIEGTINVLEAANECNIKKMVYTSSVAAVGSSINGNKKNEENWNDNAAEFYAKSKTDAERILWQKADELNLNVVSILPGMIIGPNFNRHTPSTYLFEKILKEKVPMILPIEFSLVDARDVAIAHIDAFENEACNGRYITAGEPLKMQNIINIIAKVRPELKLPTKLVPAFLYPFLPLLDKIEALFTGSMRTITQGVVNEYLDGSAQDFDTTKIRNDLNWKPRSIEQSIADTLTWVENNKINLG